MAQSQAHPLTSGARDSVNTTIVPIILVPGVMGSRLDMLGSGPNWDPDSRGAMLSWATLAQRRVAETLDVDNPCAIMFELSGRALRDIRRNPALRRTARRSLPPGTRSTLGRVFAERGWGSVAWSAYGRILMRLEDRLNLEPAGTILRPVYAAGYDWRQGNRDSGLRLRDRIVEILERHPPAEQAIIISHSMGGLVTRSALRDGADAMLAGVVHTVMPSDGAPVAYRRFQTGAVRPFDGGFFDITARVLNAIMGETRLQYAVTQARLRGPLELLPSSRYPIEFVRLTDGTTNRDFFDVFDIYLQRTPPGVVPTPGEQDPDTVIVIPTPPFGTPTTIAIPGIRAEVADVEALSANLRRARGFQLFLNSASPTAHRNTIVFFGSELVTDQRFDWNQPTSGVRDGFAQKVVREPPGDGTVPRVSAEFQNADPPPMQRTAFGVEHADCFNDTGFREAVEVAVRTILARAGVFPPTGPPPTPAPVPPVTPPSGPPPTR